MISFDFFFVHGGLIISKYGLLDFLNIDKNENINQVQTYHTSIKGRKLLRLKSLENLRES